MDQLNLYEVLGVAPDAGEEEIKKVSGILCFFFGIDLIMFFNL